MEFRLFHFYPDLMNLYGSYGNLSVLRRLLERLGHTAEIVPVQPGEDAPLRQADFFFLGAGTERRQRFAMRDLSRYQGDIKAAAFNGLPMLFCGNAMELLGKSVLDVEGNTFLGLGVAEFTATQVKRRIVGDVYGHTDLFPEPIVGFMNKSSRVTDVGRPLIQSMDLGFGNHGQKGPEGFHVRNVFASELTGPILVKNPRLLEAVAAAILKRKGAEVPETWPVDPWAEKGYAVTEAELRKRFQGK